MTTPQRSFLIPLTVFTLACGVAAFAILKAVRAPLTLHYLFTLIYFAATTFFLHRWQEGNLSTDPQGSVRRFMTGLVIKMFLSVFVLVVLLLVAPKPVIVPLALCFAVLYLAYLVFSTARLLRLSRTAPRP